MSSLRTLTKTTIFGVVATAAIAYVAWWYAVNRFNGELINRVKNLAREQYKQLTSPKQEHENVEVTIKPAEPTTQAVPIEVKA
jgi:hypothetical protein